MPIIKDNSFKPNIFFKNKHFNTIYRHFSKTEKINYKRERLTTKDNDFIDLDISSVNSNKLIIAIHGLEGNSKSKYILALVNIANLRNYDVITVNLRGCSGTPNNKLNSYHSGKTEDLFDIIEFVNKKYKYSEINIVGYSLGGNITIKFMGEFAEKMPSNLNKAVAISVPCKLKDSAIKLSKGFNKLYQYRFLSRLKKKAKIKFLQFPNHNLDENKILSSKNFKQFDNSYTAKANSFKNADDYWTKSSSEQFIKDIRKPVLLITAKDDPFLTDSCFPFNDAKQSSSFYLLQTKYGGHVGFYQGFKSNSWLENKILDFLK